MAMLAKIPLLLDGERFGLKPFEDILCEQPSNQDIYFLAFPFDSNLMIGFVGGGFAWEMSAAGRDVAVDFATGALKRVFGNDAAKHVAKGDLSRWASNPWVRGAYSAARPGRTLRGANWGVRLRTGCFSLARRSRANSRRLAAARH